MDLSPRLVWAVCNWLLGAELAPIKNSPDELVGEGCLLAKTRSAMAPSLKFKMQKHMDIRYHLGLLLKKCGYKMTRDYRWPEVHGNLLVLGYSLVQAKQRGPLQIIQIGAFDGQLADPLEPIIQNERVSVILVEPQAVPYQKLVERYKNNSNIRAINAAVSEVDGQTTLYVPSAEASPMASLKKQHFKRFGIKSSDMREVVVPSISVPSLVAHCPARRVDILQLDTEGMDHKILKWFFLMGIEPNVINFETLHLVKDEREESRALLTKKGYWWIDTNQDTCAIKESLVLAGREETLSTRA